MPPPQQHLSRPRHHPDQPENELVAEPVDAKSSGWESERGYKHLPGETKGEWEEMGNLDYHGLVVLQVL